MHFLYGIFEAILMFPFSQPIIVLSSNWCLGSTCHYRVISTTEVRWFLVSYSHIIFACHNRYDTLNKSLNLETKNLNIFNISCLNAWHNLFDLNKSSKNIDQQDNTKRLFRNSGSVIGCFVILVPSSITRCIRTHTVYRSKTVCLRF